MCAKHLLADNECGGFETTTRPRPDNENDNAVLKLDVSTKTIKQIHRACRTIIVRQPLQREYVSMTIVVTILSEWWSRKVLQRVRKAAQITG